MQEQENMTLGQEQEDSTENVSRETKSDLTITFEPKYGDIFDGLDSTDTADGTNRKSRNLFLLASFLMCVQLVGFIYTRSGIALIFALVLGLLAVILKKKSQRFNHEIAKAFEEEGTQTVVLTEENLHLNDKVVPYSEIVKFYELKRSFSIVYQGNHIYVIPKNVLEPQQSEQLVELIQQRAGSVYQNTLKK